MSQPLEVADPSPSPIPSPRATGPSLFFSAQDNATTLDLSQLPTRDRAPEEPQTDGPDDVAADWASDPGPSEASPSSLDGDPPSSPTSDPAGRPNPLTRRAAKDTARAAVRTAGVMAHRTLATTRGKVQAGLYLTDEEDEKAIGDPLGNLAHRHAGVLGGAVSDDTADLMQAAFGVAGYFAKQMNAIAAARRIDAGGQQPTVEQEAAL